jgi:hypothetical protein
MPYSGLLQLPESALDLVLQLLDKHSLASTAATCSKLRYAVPASINPVKVQCPLEMEDVMVGSFNLWLERHRTRLTNLQQCSLASYDIWDEAPTLQSLLCPQLRHLHLRGWKLRLEAAGGFRGVLRDCTGLTALHLDRCRVRVTHRACTAIAALPDLQHLKSVTCQQAGPPWGTGWVHLCTVPGAAAAPTAHTPQPCVWASARAARQPAPAVSPQQPAAPGADAAAWSCTARWLAPAAGQAHRPDRAMPWGLW